MSILAILAIVPVLISSVESLFQAFPGSGAVKKNVVTTAVSNIVTAANSVGAKIDAAFVNSTLGTLIDDYVATQNALGTAGFAQAQANAAAETKN